MLKKLLKNKLVLYLITFLAVTNVVGHLLRNDINSVIFFVVSGYLSSYFSKNMIINLLVAILGTNILIANNYLYEGMKGGGQEDDDSGDNEDGTIMESMQRKKKKKGRSGMVGGRSTLSGQQDDKTDESEGPRIDAASNLAETYKSLEGVLGPAGMQNLAKDTKKLVEQQQGLMKSVEHMQPMMKQLGGMVQSFGGVDGIQKMMDSLKNFGPPKPATNHKRHTEI